jgi:hypothetical protein
MKRYNVLLAALGVAAMIGLAAVPAGAVPTNGETLHLECDVLGSTDIATNLGNGQWTPGFVTGSSQRLIPYAFHFEFTPPGGPTFTDDVSKPAPRNGRLDRCTFSGSDPDGAFSGIVWLSYTRAR